MNRWQVMGFDTFARELYCVGDYASEAEAQAEVERQERLIVATQGEGLRNEIWIVPPATPDRAEGADPPSCTVDG